MSIEADVHALVERHWCTVITLYDVDLNAAVNEIFAFEESMASWAGHCSPLEAQGLRSAIVVAREVFADRCRADHLQLRRDLDLPMQGNQLTMNLIANLETSTTLDPKMYLHDFWRTAIALPDREKHKAPKLWNDLCLSLQQRLSSFPKTEQDAFFTRIAVLNETYMKTFKNNPAMIRELVGSSPEQPSEPPIGVALVKSALDAIVGNGMSSFLSRLFR